MNDESSQMKSEKKSTDSKGVIKHGLKALPIYTDQCVFMKENIDQVVDLKEESVIVSFNIHQNKLAINWDKTNYVMSCSQCQAGEYFLDMIVNITSRGETHIFPYRLIVSDPKTPSHQNANMRTQSTPKTPINQNSNAKPGVITKTPINQNNNTQIEATPKVPIGPSSNVQTEPTLKPPVKKNIDIQTETVPQMPTQQKIDTQIVAIPKTLINPDVNAQKEAEAKIILHKITLPNCKTTGIDYREALENKFSEFIKSKGIGELTVNPKIDHNAKFDINWDPEKYIISCHPDQAGDYEINLYADVIKNGKPEKHQFQFKLTVNPDPKSLWKNIPSNQDGVYAKLDCDKIFLPCTKNLSIVAASQRGRSHAQEGNPRDDDFIADWDAGTCCAVLITADGAGSAKFSRKGSQIATRTVLEKVKTSLGEKFWTDLEPGISKYIDDNDLQAKKNIQILLYKVLVTAAWEAKVQIKNEAEKHEKKYLADYKKSEKFTARDYATTLIVTIVKKLDIGGWFIATYWVGDGGMGVYQSNPGKIIVQGTPDGGEYGGQTRFLTEDSSEVWPQGDDAANKIIERRIHFDVVKSFDAVILMTDGITDPKFETDSNLNSLTKWNEFWADVNKGVPLKKRDASVAEALLNWMDFWSPGNHDDRTMLILY